MVVFSPHTFHETSVSEVASIFAVFHSRVFAREVVATNNVNIRSLRFFIGPPLRSICHSLLSRRTERHSRQATVNEQTEGRGSTLPRAISRAGRGGALNRGWGTRLKSPGWTI